MTRKIEHNPNDRPWFKVRERVVSSAKNIKGVTDEDINLQTNIILGRFFRTSEVIDPGDYQHQSCPPYHATSEQ